MSGDQIVKRSGTSEEFIWLKASYHFHVFHYRMPDTAAIAAVTPFVPSPLTIKMAMIASLFQVGDVNGADIIARNMHKIEVKIIPPRAAISFKAFLRYRSPPAVESGEKGLDETGSYYPSRPHMREYAIFQDSLEIYVRVPSDIAEYSKKSLKNIRYLGSKDSIVTCFDLKSENPPQDRQFVNKLDRENTGIVVLLADFKQGTKINNLETLIPGNRDNKMYEKSPYTLPGNIITIGKTKIFIAR